MTMLISSEKGNPSDVNWRTGVCAKMVKADLCGAKIIVFDSNNKSLIGTKGIIAKESQRTFVVVNKKNESKVILKKNSVFTVVLPTEGHNINLWGDMLLYKGSERTKIKFKERGSLNLY